MKRSVFFYLALVCWFVVAILIGAYLGMCSTLVEDDSGGKGEVGALIMIVVFGTASVFFWRRRHLKMS